MATLKTLRRRVLIRLDDLEQRRALAADEFLNEAQDEFLRLTGYHRVTQDLDVTSGGSSHVIAIPEGLAMVEVKSVTYQSALRVTPLALTTVEEMDGTHTSWRTMRGLPEWYIRNINLDGGPAIPNSISIFPVPSDSVEKGLRVIFTARTDGTLTDDDAQTLYPEFDDALISYALAQMGHPAAADKFKEFEARVTEARALANRGYENQTIRVKSARR